MLHSPTIPRCRIVLIAISRSEWYSSLVRVCDGATAADSPVWIPIGSRFSMLHTVMQLSAASRTTSYSTSFHPCRYSSIRTCGTERKRGVSFSESSASLRITPDPSPPSANPARSMTGNPISDLIFFDKNLRHRTKERRKFLRKLSLAPYNTRSFAAECEPRPQHDGEPDISGGTQRFLGSFCSMASRRLNPYFRKAFDEQVSVLGVAYRFYGSSKNANAIFFQYTFALEFETEIERRLAAEREQDGVRLLLFYHLDSEFNSEWKEVDRVGKSFVSLYGRDIWIDKDDVHTLFFQRLDRLRARVIEFTGLTYLEAAGAEEQDLFWFLGHMILRNHAAQSSFKARPFFNDAMNSSNIHAVSVGPGEASGWNCTERHGLDLWRMPSLEPSFAFTNHSSHPAGSVFPSTAKPWFWDVI